MMPPEIIVAGASANPFWQPCAECASNPPKKTFAAIKGSKRIGNIDLHDLQKSLALEMWLRLSSSREMPIRGYASGGNFPDEVISE
jgi:hypothetical protein